MAKTTTDIQTMKRVHSEMDKNYTAISQTTTKLSELFREIMDKWSGAGGDAFREASDRCLADFWEFVHAMADYVRVLEISMNNYSRADSGAAEVVKSKLK